LPSRPKEERDLIKNWYRARFFTYFRDDM